MNLQIPDSFPILKTERLSLRQTNISDSLSFYSMRTDRESMKFMDMEQPKSIEHARQKIMDEIELFKNKMGIYWTIGSKINGEYMGGAGFLRLTDQHFRAEIGYQLDKKFWRQGFAEEALTSIIDFGFNKMNLHSIEANVNPANTPSTNLLQKLGFKREAHFRENYFFDGKFLDSFIYCLLISDWTKTKDN